MKCSVNVVQRSAKLEPKRTRSSLCTPAPMTGAYFQGYPAHKMSPQIKGWLYLVRKSNAGGLKRMDVYWMKEGKKDQQKVRNLTYVH